MKKRPFNLSRSAYQRFATAVLFSLLLAMLLQGCAGVFYSSLTDADIRATAYDIATTRLATTIEVPPEVARTLAPGQPTATLDPTFCPPDAVAVWVDAALADIAILDQEISILLGEVYTPDQLIQIVKRAEERSAAWELEEEPRCAIKANRRLAQVYDQFAETINARLSGDLNALPQAKLKLQQSIQKLMDAIREFVHGEAFKPFDDLLSKYQ
ncbi:MAG: hypothetical protein OEV06_04865 [Anaerolineae bacterium]|nr:hypothetical protein [Anaerolineae bacterium]